MRQKTQKLHADDFPSSSRTDASRTSGGCAREQKIDAPRVQKDPKTDTRCGRTSRLIEGWPPAIFYACQRTTAAAA